MKIHLVRKQTIENYVLFNAQSRTPFQIWLKAIKNSNWNGPADRIKLLNSADLLGRRTDRVIFNIGGNNYRMICKYLFGQMQVHLFICWIGTHSEYDDLCYKNEQYTVSDY